MPWVISAMNLQFFCFLYDIAQYFVRSCTLNNAANIIILNQGRY